MNLGSLYGLGDLCVQVIHTDLHLVVNQYVSPTAVEGCYMNELQR